MEKITEREGGLEVLYRNGPNDYSIESRTPHPDGSCSSSYHSVSLEDAKIFVREGGHFEMDDPIISPEAMEELDLLGTISSSSLSFSQLKSWLRA